MRPEHGKGVREAASRVGTRRRPLSASRTAFGVSRRSALVAVVLATLAQFQAAPVAADRVALVIGNSEYVHAGPLPNPGNDATAVSESLGRLGFEVTTVLDGDRVEMNEALRVFSRQSATADVAAVFYAGHGIEVDGVNYLVPVDAQLERDTDVSFENLTLDTVLGATQGASLRLVILDACRNNPLARTMQRTARTRSISRGSFAELNEEQLTPGLVVAYAAAAGTTADDGQGRHSPYTRALLQYLEAPAEIIQVFRWVQGAVLEETNGRQQPHLYFSLPGERFLNENASAAVAVGTGLPSEAVMSRLEDVVDRLNELTNGRPPSEAAATLPAGSRTTADRLAALLGRELSTFDSDENGWTDLYYAAALNQPSLAERLLDNYAFVNGTLYIDGGPLTDRLRETLSELGQREFDLRREGQTPLHVAAYAGAAETAAILLDRGADVDAVDTLGQTPLHVAAKSARVDVMRELLTRGADGTLRADDSMTALDLVLASGSIDGMRILLMHGLPVNEPNARGVMPLHTAALSGHAVGIRELVGRGADVNARTDDGVTPLHHAATADAAVAIRELAGRGADVNAQTFDGEAPLHRAAAANAVAAIRELAGRGADVNAQRNDGMTPLHVAAGVGAVDAVRELGEYDADVNAQAGDGATPLHRAAAAGSLEALRELLRRGADIERLTGRNETALHFLAQGGYVAAIRGLVERGADVRRRTSGNDTALHFAARGGHVEAVRVLSDLGAGLNAETNAGVTPLHRAAEAGSVEAIQELVDRGADVRSLTHNNETALHFAAQGGHVGAIQELAAREVDLGRRNRRNETALHFAARGGHVAAIRELVAGGADVRRRTDDGETALHFVARSGSIEGVRELIEHGADVRRRRDDDETALHLAAAAGHVDVIRELVTHGADVDRRADNDVTPLHFAAAGGHAGAIGELVARGADIQRPARGGITALHFAVAGERVEAIRELVAVNPAANLTLMAARTDSSRAGTTPWWLSSATLAWRSANGPGARAGRGSLRLIAGGTPLEWAEQLGHTEAAALLRSLGL